MTHSLLKSVPLSAWTFERFGLSLTKLRYRVWDPGAPKVLCAISRRPARPLERAIRLHPKLYRKLLPTVPDENAHRWGGLSGYREDASRPSRDCASPVPPRLLRNDRSRRVRPMILVRDPPTSSSPRSTTFRSARITGSTPSSRNPRT